MSDNRSNINSAGNTNTDNDNDADTDFESAAFDEDD